MLNNDSPNEAIDIDDESSESIIIGTPAKKQKSSTSEQWSQFDNLRRDMQKNNDKKLDLIQKIVQKSPEKTDLELFFNSISKTVQKFTPKDQAVLKIKIYQLVSEKEISNLDNTQKSADDFINDLFTI